MRVKTDQQRRAIVETARHVFGQAGFDRTSMSAISATLGGSKTTLYSYFASKEELFAAVMLDAVKEHTDRFQAIFEQRSGSLRSRLRRFGCAYLDLVLSPEVVAIVRSGIEMREDELGRLLYERGPALNWHLVAGFLAREMAAGRLRTADPLDAALHLKGLLQAGLFEPYLFGAPAQVSTEKAVRNAVDVFLRAYHPE